jgi:hypothetical protein
MKSEVGDFVSGDLEIETGLELGIDVAGLKWF